MSNTYVNINAIESKDYRCPKCLEMHNNEDDGYDINGIKYPQIFNENQGSTFDGSYYNWDELHKCEFCTTEYWFRNEVYSLNFKQKIIINHERK